VHQQKFGGEARGWNVCAFKLCDGVAKRCSE